MNIGVEVNSKVKISLVAGHRYGHRLASIMCQHKDEIEFAQAFVQHPRTMLQYKGYESPLSVLSENEIPIILFDKVSELDNLDDSFFNTDYTLVCGLRQIIPRSLIFKFIRRNYQAKKPYSPKSGVICFHPSDLPKGRGLSPVQWSIFNQDTTGTVTSFFIDFGEIDAGPIIEKKHFDILPNYDAGDLHSIIGEAIVSLYVSMVDQIISQNVIYSRQSISPPDSKPRHQFTSKDSWVDTATISADNLCLTVRAFSKPYGGVYALANDRPINIFKSVKEDFLLPNITVGRIEMIDGKSYLKCTDGIVRLDVYNFLDL